jgi:hypothetical protein
MYDSRHSRKDTPATDTRQEDSCKPDGAGPARSDPACQPPADDRIAAALLLLLVQATTRGACMHQMQSIGDHLRLLAEEPSASALLRETSAKLHAHWQRCLESIEQDRSGASMTIERTVIERSVH